MYIYIYMYAYIYIYINTYIIYIYIYIAIAKVPRFAAAVLSALLAMGGAVAATWASSSLRLGLREYGLGFRFRRVRARMACRLGCTSRLGLAILSHVDSMVVSVVCEEREA